MPFYKIERQERGEMYRTYTVPAANADEALELMFEGGIEPDSEYFEQRDAETFVTEIDAEDVEFALSDSEAEELGL